jgi:hypothetical protein
MMGLRLSLAVAAAIPAMAVTVQALPVNDLPGRWSGFGDITLSSGAKEQMRCVATYFVDGPSLKQNLRCASAGYKIDAAANMMLANDQVSGDWEEKIWSTNGAISGRMLDSGFTLKIAGPGFTADLVLTTTNCKQTISITPRGNDISNISMALAKC